MSFFEEAHLGLYSKIRGILNFPQSVTYSNKPETLNSHFSFRDWVPDVQHSVIWDEYLVASL